MNLNDMVTVALTERGAEIYNAYMAQFPEKIRRPKVESGQLLKTQLWDLFRIFGRHIHPGSTAPFNECEIDTGSEEIESLRAQLAEAKSEVQEQARLNGIGSEREAKLLAQLDEAKVEITCEERRFSDLWEQLCSTQAQLAEVTRERDDYKQAIYDLGLTPEEARAGAKRSRDIKQQLLATQAHAARLVEVLRGIAKQTPEKPDYWSSCCQCEHNISDAEEAISTPINLDALHEDRARTLEEAAKNWIYGSTFNVLNEMAATHRARKEQK